MATRVVDSDAHVIEGQELMAELLARFPDQIRMARPDEEGAALVIEGRRYPNASGPGAGCHAKHGLCLDRGASPFTAEGVMRDADREGIDAMVFFPSAALGLPAFTDLAFAAECARLYTRWLAGYCGQFPRRMFGVGLVPIEDVATSIRIMREARELGLVAIMVPAVLRTRNLDHRDLEPFYAAAEELEMPLGIHGAPGIHLPPLGAERFDNYLQVHVLSFPFDMMVATTALVLGGVLERHPRLRVALLESGVGWVPYFFDRLDAHVEKRGRLTPECKREPLAGLLEPYDLEPEFRVLHALSDDPLPSPPTPWFTRDPAVLERPFYVMERLPGEVPIPAARADGSGPFDDAERAALGPQVARALARLHAIDWRARGFQFLGAPRPGREAAEHELARWEERIRRSGLPVSPPLAEALLWCRRHAPATDAITLVHGDYRLGNFLVVHEAGGPRLTGILDWELVHLGDPLEDVAWCASPLWRAGTPYASALLPPEEFAARWAEASGRTADPERLCFYAMLAFVKMIAIMLSGLAAFRSGRTSDLRMAIFDHQFPFLHLLLGMTRGWLAGAPA